MYSVRANYGEIVQWEDTNKSTHSVFTGRMVTIRQDRPEPIVKRSHTHTHPSPILQLFSDYIHRIIQALWRADTTGLSHEALRSQVVGLDKEEKQTLNSLPSASPPSYGHHDSHRSSASEENTLNS